MSYLSFLWFLILNLFKFVSVTIVKFHGKGGLTEKHSRVEGTSQILKVYNVNNVLA